MIKPFCLSLILFLPFFSFPQNDYEEAVQAGISDIEQFSKQFLNPAAKSALYSTHTSWYHSAECLVPGQFRVSLKGNATFIDEKDKFFQMDINDYQAFQFEDGSQTKKVSTALGVNSTPIKVMLAVQNQEIAIRLPDGLGKSNVSFVPPGFLQASVGVFDQAEVNLRYTPKIDMDNDIDLYGFGVGFKYNFSKWFKIGSPFPIDLAVFAGYTNYTAEFEFNEIANTSEGGSLRVESDLNSFQTSAIGEVKILDFWKLALGLDYNFGNSDTELRGQLDEFINVRPFSLQDSISGLAGTFSTTFTAGNFSLDLVYNYRKYSNGSIGFNYKIN